MPYLILSLTLSALITLLLIRYQHLHANFSGDHQSGPQKFHVHQVSRIGGVSIFLSLLLCMIIRGIIDSNFSGYLPLLLIAALPTFGIGLLEDVTKKVGVKVRLFVTAFSALLFGFFFNAWITSFHLPIIDQLFLITGVPMIFTCFACAGVANAYNIIDGFNGLASMVGIITLGAIGYIGFKVGDVQIYSLSLLMIGAIGGFFVWNYPKGFIFLGDGGAYLIGFYIATCTILLVTQHSEVSPWFALLVNAYPVTETLFTIWRRSIHQGKNPGLPDAAHFHSLVYRRVVRWSGTHPTQNTQETFGRNARTSPYLWLLSSLGVFPAILFWNNTLALQISCLVYCLIYVWLYRCIVRFKVLRFTPPRIKDK